MSPTHAWLHAASVRIAQRHFGGRAAELEQLLQSTAERLEARWASTERDSFRPTATMLALGLEWELEKSGPNCYYCRRPLEPPTTPVPSRPRGPEFTLGLRVAPAEGGMNVPQNVVFGHSDCFPEA